MPKGRSKRGARNNRRAIVRPPRGLRDPNSQVVSILMADDIDMLSSNATNLSAAVAIAPKATVSDIFSGFVQAYRFYRINWVTIMITPISTSAGSTVFYFDNTSSSPPTATSAAGAIGLNLVNNSAAAKMTSVHGHQFVGYSMYSPFPHNGAITDGTNDISYFEWLSTSITLPTPIYLKVFTDNGSYGSPISTNLWTFRTLYSVSFKTQKS